MVEFQKHDEWKVSHKNICQMILSTWVLEEANGYLPMIYGDKKTDQWLFGEGKPNGKGYEETSGDNESVSYLYWGGGHIISLKIYTFNCSSLCLTNSISNKNYSDDDNNKKLY